MGLFKYTTYIIFISLFIFQCNKDDDSDSDPIKYLNGVPSGAIVPLNKRDEVLTGDPNGVNGQELAGPLIWWTLSESTYLDCSGKPLGDAFENIEFSFGTDGNLYSRFVGTSMENREASWKWSNSAKEYIIYNETIFIITELNNSVLTYASNQFYNDVCVITYMRFTK